LTFFTVALVFTLSSLLGGSIVTQNYEASVEAVNVEIQTITVAISTSESDKVTTALSLIQEAGTPLSLFLLDEANKATPISEAASSPTPSAASIKDLDEGSVVRTGSTLLSIVALEEGSRLLIVGSVKAAIDQRDKNFLSLALSLIAIIVISLICLRIVISRDIKRERQSIERDERLRIEESKRESLLEFAGDASHELRTPLTVIKGYLELLLTKKEETGNRDALSRMLREANRMEQTLDQLLQFVAVEAAPQELPESLDLSIFLQDSLEGLAVLGSKRPISTSLEQGLLVHADRNILNRIIDNIFMNIHRHTSGVDPVEVRTYRDRDNAVLEIHDGGPGIPHLINDAQVRPFKRFDPSRSRDTGGSGLGLSIIDSSVRRLNGRLTIGRSQLGGLMVRVDLPLETK
jgi:two-component system OmpR family sensor kinase